MKVFSLFFRLLFGPAYLSAIAQQTSPGNKDNFAGVNARGDQGMGFSHEKTTHHFHLLAEGGAIEIQSNEPTDAASQEAIRQHLAMIAVKFSQGDFAIPMFIHATVPPGVETMKRLISKINYDAENTERGAQLRITTQDAEALTGNPQLSHVPDPGSSNGRLPPSAKVGVVISVTNQPGNFGPS